MGLALPRTKLAIIWLKNWVGVRRFGLFGTLGRLGLQTKNWGSLKGGGLKIPC